MAKTVWSRASERPKGWGSVSGLAGRCAPNCALSIHAALGRDRRERQVAGQHHGGAGTTRRRVMHVHGGELVFDASTSETPRREHSGRLRPGRWPLWTSVRRGRNTT